MKYKILHDCAKSQYIADHDDSTLIKDICLLCFSQSTDK